MVNDGKPPEPQKDKKAESRRIEEERQTISAQCTIVAKKISESTDANEIQGLMAELSNLAARAEAIGATGIISRINNLIAAAGAKEETLAGRHIISSEASEADKAAEAAAAQEAQEREKKWDNDPKRGEWTQDKVEAAYKDFYEISPAYHKKQDKRIKALKNALNEIGSEKGLSEESKRLLLDDRELEEERKRCAIINRAGEAAKASYDHHSQELKAIKEERERAEKNGVPLTKEREKELRHKEAHHNKKAKADKVALDDHEVHKEKWAEEAKIIKAVVEKAEAVGKDEEKVLAEVLSKRFEDQGKGNLEKMASLAKSDPAQNQDIVAPQQSIQKQKHQPDLKRDEQTLLAANPKPLDAAEVQTNPLPSPLQILEIDSPLLSQNIANEIIRAAKTHARKGVPLSAPSDTPSHNNQVLIAKKTRKGGRD